MDRQRAIEALKDIAQHDNDSLVELLFTEQRVSPKMHESWAIDPEMVRGQLQITPLQLINSLLPDDQEPIEIEIDADSGIIQDIK